MSTGFQNLQLLPTSGEVRNGPTAAAKTETGTEHMAAVVPKINLPAERKVGEAISERRGFGRRSYQHTDRASELQGDRTELHAQHKADADHFK